MMAAMSNMTTIHAVNHAGLGPDAGTGLPAAAQSKRIFVRLTSEPDTRTRPRFHAAPWMPM